MKSCAAFGRSVLAGAWLLLLNACASPPLGPPGTEADNQVMREHPERLIVVALANPRDQPILSAGSTASGYAATERYGASGSARATLAALKSEYRLRELAAWPIRALHLHCVVLEIALGDSRDVVLMRLAKDERIEIAQALQTFGVLSGADSRADAGYNDPYVDLQRGFIDMEAAQAHLTSRGRGVSIGIIDTGADTTHPDLKDRVRITRNFVDGDSIRFNRDRHGTEVAGVIGAVANNRQGIVGIAPEVHLAVYKACWQQKSGDVGARCNSFTLAQAPAAVIEDGPRIINLSLGGPNDELLARLVAHAIRQGRIVIGAMPPDGSSSGFPAAVAGVISVDVAGRGNTRADVLKAPGRDVLTLQPAGNYDFDSGSSLAAAHVSAAVALLLGAEPSLDAASVRSLLMRSQAMAHADASFSACAALALLRHEAACASGSSSSLRAGRSNESISLD